MLSRRRVLVVLLALVSFAAALPAQDAVAKELVALERRWMAAQMKHDGAAVGALLSEDFLSISDKGLALTKAQMIRNTSESRTTYASGELTGFQTKVHGNAAVIVGVVTYGITKGKETVTARYAWTDTWVKQANGTWLCVASQSTEMK